MFVNRRFWERGQEALLVRLEEHLARIRVPEKNIRCETNREFYGVFTRLVHPMLSS